MRDYAHIDRYLNELLPDIYEQPPDDGHQAAIDYTVAHFIGPLKVDSVLDVGCAQGQAFAGLQHYARRVVGVTLGNDANICEAKGLEVYRFDMSFMPFGDGEFDVIFARHVIEHSPMPLVTLMEWHRIARRWLVMVTPDLDHFGPGGRNHYYVLRPDQWANLLTRAGWNIVKAEWQRNLEYRWLCERVER